MQLKICLYDIDSVDKKSFEEFAGRSIEKIETNVKFLRYNSHNCYVNNSTP